MIQSEFSYRTSQFSFTASDCIKLEPVLRILASLSSTHHALRTDVNIGY